MLSETDILTASNGARWLYQSLFSLTVTRDEIILSALAGVVFFLFQSVCFFGIFILR